MSKISEHVINHDCVIVSHSLLNRNSQVNILYIKDENEMESTDPSICTCGFQLGFFPLSSQDSQTSNLAEELSKMSINFHGPAGDNQRLLAKEKIEEIKQKVADYYYDPECKVIAIPNHFVTPKKPTVLGKVGKEKQDAQILDKYLEECLHHELVNAARNSNLETFIINSFQSGDCIQQIVKKGKDTRGKDNYAEFNQYEKRVKDILGMEDVEEDKLMSCIEEHKKWRENPLLFKGPDNWLFKQEC